MREPGSEAAADAGSPAPGGEGTEAGPVILSDEDARTVERIRAGDEAAFTELVERLHSGLHRLVRQYVRTDAVAEEVVQETWLAVLKGIDRFEGRAALKTWVSRIATNRARTRGEREARSVPLSALSEAAQREAAEGSAAVPAGRFHAAPGSVTRPAGHWKEPPRPWESFDPEKLVTDAETRAFLDGILAELPPAQRAVVTLRDLEGWTSKEVCNALELTETNQRVLLHRGRSKLRGRLEDHLAARDGQTRPGGETR